MHTEPEKSFDYASDNDRTGSGREPVSALHRLELVDVLRGIALFGVLWVNATWFATAGGTIDVSQFEALPTEALDRWARYAMDFFVAAKANTLFAFLFGVSFALQFQRLEERGPGASAIYLRRLVGLLAIGLLHLFVVWQGDVLHVYALAGFLLLCVRRAPTAVLVGGGLALAVAAHPLMTGSASVARLLALNAEPTTSVPAVALAERLAVYRQGNYLQVIAVQYEEMRSTGYFLAGLLPWVLYAFGRFMLGLAVMRHSVLTRVEKYRRAFLTTAALGLPLGLAFTMSWWAVQWAYRHGILSEDPSHFRFATTLLTSAGTLLMSAAYVAVVVLLWQSWLARRLLTWFAPVGRMALTNYVLQSFANSLIYFGYGLGLAGKVGSAACFGVAATVYAAQIAVSRIWLARFHFGPLEWLWRWWTYGSRPPWRRAGS